MCSFSSLSPPFISLYVIFLLLILSYTSFPSILQSLPSILHFLPIIQHFHFFLFPNLSLTSSSFSFSSISLCTVRSFTSTSFSYSSTSFSYSPLPSLFPVPSDPLVLSRRTIVFSIFHFYLSFYKYFLFQYFSASFLSLIPSQTSYRLNVVIISI